MQLKQLNISKYKYFGYGLSKAAFLSNPGGKGAFSFPNRSFHNNATIFGVDMSSSVQRYSNSW